MEVMRKSEYIIDYLFIDIYSWHLFRQIRRPVGQELVGHSFVLSMHDGDSVLAGLPKSAIMPLQRVQNAAARLILDQNNNKICSQL